MYLFEQLLLILIFLALSLFTFSFPGLGIIRLLKVKLPSLLEEYVLATVVGISVFTLSAYFLAAFHLRFLMWVYPVSGLLLLYVYRKIYLDLKVDITKNLVICFLLVFIVGIFSQVAVNAFSGIFHPDGIYFYSSH